MTPPTLADDALVTAMAMAEMLGISEKTLNKWRSTGENNVPYVKIGKAVRYRTADVRAWVEKRTVHKVA